MLRVGLFIATNLAIIVLASLTFQLLGLEQMLSSNGVNMDLTSLLIFCAVFGMSGAFISLLISKPMAKRSMKVQIVEQANTSQQRWLVDTVTELAQQAGIKTPNIGIFPSQVSNAFATGWNKNSALVAVSEGLLNRFTPAEAKAVLAHEIGHVANGDMITLTLVQGVINTFVMFFARIIGMLADRLIFKSQRGNGPGYWIVTIVAQIVLGILASTIVMWFSRWREYRADAAGAELAGTAAMIGALQRLQAEQDIPTELPEQLMAFGISGDKKDTISRLFMTHPPLAERIEALRQAG
ncbi:MAG: protease HtpX [Pseudomonadales bacterium]